MSIVRVGTTKKYADGWESIFGGKRSDKTTAKRSKPAKKPKKKSASRKS